MKLEMYSIEALNESLKSLPKGTNEAFMGKQWSLNEASIELKLGPK
jgi:hypothetical protein